MIRSDFSKRVCIENININPPMYYSILFPCANNYEDLSLQIQKNHLILFNFQKFTALMYHLAEVFKVRIILFSAKMNRQGSEGASRRSYFDRKKYF